MFDRPILTRDLSSEDDAPRIVTARVMPRVRRAAPAVPSAHRPYRASPQPVAVAGGSGWGEDMIGRFQTLAEQCLPPAVQKRQANCGVDANGNPVANPCARTTRRVPVGAANLVAVAANGAFIVTIPITAGFFPVLIGIPPLVAGVALAANLAITAINYGPVNKLIGTQVSGAAFDYSNDTGGYILEGGEWLTAGQTIVISGVSQVPWAIGQLAIDVHGLTNSPG